MTLAVSDRLQKILDDIVAFEQEVADKGATTPLTVAQASGDAWRMIRQIFPDLIEVAGALEWYRQRAFVLGTKEANPTTVVKATGDLVLDAGSKARVLDRLAEKLE